MTVKNNKRTISTGILSNESNFIPLDKIEINRFGSVIRLSATWGIAIPLPTTVEPSLSRLNRLFKTSRLSKLYIFEASLTMVS